MKAPPTDKLRTNILSMILAVVGLGVVIGYATVAISAQDAFWFLKRFDALPTLVIVYHDGQRTDFTAGADGFAELAEAVRVSFATGVSRPSGMGLSTGSQQDAYQRFVTVEAFFDAPVKLHAHFNTGRATQALFPITGRYSDLNVVFMGAKGAYFAGAPILKTTQPLRDALKALGFETE